jgi:hypothetical protein
MVTRPLTGSISGEATTWRGNIFLEAMRPPGWAFTPFPFVARRSCDGILRVWGFLAAAAGHHALLLKT